MVSNSIPPITEFMKTGHLLQKLTQHGELIKQACIFIWKESRLKIKLVTFFSWDMR
jgi:hypothetical protein